jgi:hypothetical protein
LIEPCYVKGQHVITDGPCTTPGCTGCLPGLAADGLLICSWHHRWGIRDLNALPGLDRDLGKALVPITSGVKTWGANSRAPGIDLDQDVVEAREYIRAKLSHLVAYVVTERGLRLPPEGTTLAMAVFLTRHAEWMSANRVLARVWTQQVRNVRLNGKRYAYRTRPTMKLGDCPLTKPDGSVCGTAVRHDPSDYAGQQVVCRGCGTTGTVDWWQATIWGDGALLPADAVAALLTTRYNRVIPPSTIRAWASKGIIDTSKDGQGRTVYDVAKVRAHADTVWPPIQTGRTA